MDRDPLDISGLTGEVIPPPGSGFGDLPGKWSPAMADRVIAIVAECGSPSVAAKQLGIKPGTIQYHRKVDAEFRARYDEAMRSAVEAVVTDSIARARDIADPANEAFTLAWLRLRGDRINAYLDGDTADRGDGMGLDPRIVSLMAPEDRRVLLGLLTKYITLQNGATDARALGR